MRTVLNVKGHTGDYFYTDGTSSEVLDENKELKGIVLQVTSTHTIILHPNTPNERVCKSEAEKWCQKHNGRLLTVEEMTAVWINRDMLKGKINFSDEEWYHTSSLDEDGDNIYVHTYPRLLGCNYYADGDSNYNFGAKFECAF